MIDPRLIEIEDLGSANGTFADGEKLQAGKKYKFTSGVKVVLGMDSPLDLSKILPGIQIMNNNNKRDGSKDKLSGLPITSEEKNSFEDLEIVWREYQERQAKLASSGSNIVMGGMAASALVASIAGGPLGLIIGVGGPLMSRYLAQHQTSKVREDFTYEDMFLITYSCPRCKESFQKKPWITIRECSKCRVKFR